MDNSISKHISSKLSKQPSFLNEIQYPHLNDKRQDKIQNLISQNPKQPQKADLPPQITLQAQSHMTMFDQYIQIVKQKVFKRKIILFILNILLTLIAFVFAICFVVWGSSTSDQQSSLKIQEIFNTQFSLVTLFCILVIGLLSAIFSVIIIKGKVILLHCYWITCLVFFVIFSIVGASAFSLVSMDCAEPSSYILQRIQITSSYASSLFCSDICPCNRGQSTSLSGSDLYDKVQDCPSWEGAIYSSFLETIEENLQCSGWCSVNPKSYFTFYSSQEKPDASTQISCFSSIRDKIDQDTSYLRIFSLLLCVMLILIIFYTNYYIFMEKEDQNREIKKAKKKMKQTQQKMEDQLKTSKRMLE